MIRHLLDRPNLRTMGTESLQINAFFGATKTQNTYCDLTELSESVVPFICNPLTSQPIDHSKQSYGHLVGLELADSAEVSDVLEIDLLIRSDSYWDLVTGQVVKGDSRPTAIQTRVG